MTDRLAEIKKRDAYSLNETQAEQDRRWLLNELRRTTERTEHAHVSGDHGRCEKCGVLLRVPKVDPLGLSINR